MAKKIKIKWNKSTFIKIAILILIILILVILLPKQAKQNGFESEVLVKNLDTPWAIAFLPDDTMIFTERPGRVSIFRDGKVKVIGEINTTEESESGLLGIAVDPEFADNNYIYLYYTHSSGNRVSRFIFDAQNGKIRDETILLDNIPNARFHDGGRIKFGPDGKLYITTGDATIPSSAQDKNSLSGKILRMNRDGTAPEDNPFGNYVYSYGHRNPQGIVWNPDTMMLYESEHGQSRNDEINIVVKGGNYGWPTECTEPGDYIATIRCYTTFTLAPSGIAFYGNDLYVAGLRGSQLRRIVFGSDHKTILSEEELFSGLGRIREVVEHDNYLYISTSNRDGRGIPGIDDDRIIRIKEVDG